MNMILFRWIASLAAPHRNDVNLMVSVHIKKKI